MPWSLTSDELPVDMASRMRAMGSHPSTMGTAPVPRFVNQLRGYESLEMTPERAASVAWPRATVRPVPGLAEGETTWIAVIWKERGVPVRMNAQMVATQSNDRDWAFEWARREVDVRRDPKDQAPGSVK